MENISKMIDPIKLMLDFKALIIIFGMYLFYKLGIKRYDLHLRVGCKGPTPFPFLGNLIQLYKYGEYQFLRMCREKYGKIYPLYFGNVKMIMVSDDEIIRQITIKSSENFMDKWNIGFFGKYLMLTLNGYNGKDWERLRSALTPVFTSGKLRKMTPLVEDAVNLMEERLDKHLIGKPFLAKDVFGAFSMDVMARTMFGMKIDTQNNPNNLFVQNAKEIINISFNCKWITIFGLFPSISNVFRKRNRNYVDPSINYFIANFKKVVEERQKSSETYNDFLNLMLNLKIDDKEFDQMNDLNNKYLTFDEILGQCLLFLVTSYGSTAVTMTFVGYFIARNPDVQKEIYEEILKKIGINGKITYDLLMDLPLLDAAINETLRICPSQSRVDRMCMKDTILTTSDNKTIIAKKGDIFSIPISAIQSDPSIWPDPDIFDLHRFDPENKKTHGTYSWNSFGIGSRSCIGMRFALLEIKWLFVSILRKYELVLCPGSMDVLKLQKLRIPTPIKPIILKVVQRN